MTTLLPASLQNALQGIVERANLRGASLRAILLSTTEGVPLGRVVCSTTPSSDEHNANLNEELLASIESVWAPASKQFPVLGLDRVQQVTAVYDHGTLVHVYQAPMVCVLPASLRALVAEKNTAFFLRLLLLLFMDFVFFVPLFCTPGDYHSVRTAGQSRGRAFHRHSPFETSVGAAGPRTGQFPATGSQRVLSRRCRHWVLSMINNKQSSGCFDLLHRP